MASTRSRPRGREHARPSAGGVAAEHATKIYTVATIGIVVIVAFLALTSVGHLIDAATQHFMLYYAGVFALITLCASVGLGLVATDRMFMSPGHRVLIQSMHRAASFGAVAFLIIHITTEILAQRVHVLDAVIPFLSPFRTFYIGLGTIASDLIILLLITGILRGRFNASGKAWRWRAIHYTSYLAFVFGVWHGLLGGRPGKPYVDWSYGFVVALVLLGLAVRVLSNSLKPKENLSAPPVDMAANSASAPLRAAAMLAQYGGSRVGRTSILGASTGSQPVLSAPVTAQVLTALPAGGAATDPGQPYYEPGYEGPPRYLGAPRSTGTGPMPRAATGPMPRAATGSLPRAGTGPMPRATGPMPAAGTGPLPPSVSGPMPRMNSGPMPRAGSGPMPRAATGPMPRSGTGPYPAGGPYPGPYPASGPYPAPHERPQAWTGPMPRAATGPLPQVDDGRGGDWGTGPRSRPAPGPVPGGRGPRGGTGPRPRPTGPMATGTGPYERPSTGTGGYERPSAGTGGYERPSAGTGGYERPSTGTGPYERPSAGTGGYERPSAGTGGYERPSAGTGGYERPSTGTGGYERPSTGTGGYERRSTGTGPYERPSTGTGSYERPSTGTGGYERPSTRTGPSPRPATGPMPQFGRLTPPSGYPDGAGGMRPDRQEWQAASYEGSWYPEEPQWDNGFPETDPNLRYREPGPGMPGYRGSREHRYGGDRY